METHKGERWREIFYEYAMAGDDVPINPEIATSASMAGSTLSAGIDGLKAGCTISQTESTIGEVSQGSQLRWTSAGES